MYIESFDQFMCFDNSEMMKKAMIKKKQSSRGVL